MKTVKFATAFNIRRLLGFLVLFGLVGATAAEAAGSRKNPMLDENRTHKLSIFSFAQSLGGRGPSFPVLVTLNVKGPKALTQFCENQPKINEAVLHVLSKDTGKADRKAVLRSVKRPLRKAVNKVLKGKPVRKVQARAGRTPAEFGPDLMQTKRVCKAIKG